LANTFKKFIVQLLPKCVDEVENLHKSNEALGRIGKTPFTTMGIIENYSNLSQIDVNDSKFSYIMWFLSSKYLILLI
jgi:hypothetical protein